LGEKRGGGNITRVKEKTNEKEGKKRPESPTLQKGSLNIFNSKEKGGIANQGKKSRGVRCPEKGKEGKTQGRR